MYRVKRSNLTMLISCSYQIPHLYQRSDKSYYFQYCTSRLFHVMRTLASAPTVLTCPCCLEGWPGSRAVWRPCMDSHHIAPLPLSLSLSATVHLHAFPSKPGRAPEHPAPAFHPPTSSRGRKADSATPTPLCLPTSSTNPPLIYSHCQLTGR